MTGYSLRPCRALAMGMALTIMLAATQSAAARDLYRDRHNGWAALVSDQRARNIGDILTVVVYENASASNSAQNGSSKSQSLDGRIAGGSLSEDGELSFGGSYSGRGEVRRSGRMVAQISVEVTDRLTNGDFMVAGKQVMFINGEATDIGIEGRVREADITSDNRILSSRIAEARITYDGKGFVTRSAKPGLITRIFRFLGLS
ncbi:MAG: flagellar basal body L-ring protein FlgH [Pseudomonadota bacterium]